MSIVSHSYAFVIGVDTHARRHAFTIYDTTTRQHLDAAEFPVTPAGLSRAISWAGRRTAGIADVLWVIEGAASYGATLTGQVLQAGYVVVEPARMNTRANYAVGKDDAVDARRIAESVLTVSLDRLRYPRLDEGIRAAVQVLLTSRDQLVAERTRAVNALTALLRGRDLGIDARGPLATGQIMQVSRWRDRDSDPLAARIARREAVRVAGRILEVTDLIDDNTAELRDLVASSIAAPLLDEHGFGPVSAARCLAAFSHTGRIRDEAGFAALAGTTPIPASSGNTKRHRLNRGGDRKLNSALHTVALTRARSHPATRAYIERRTREGKTPREIRRCLKRYIARHVFRVLTSNSG